MKSPSGFCTALVACCVIGTAVGQNFTASITLSLEDYWNEYVGPIEQASVNTTVEATPVPTNSLIPPPGLYYPPFPTGHEAPLQTKNESWSFPKDFKFGVSSAAYQVEGAAKDEGKGPSIWDVLSHRVPGYITTNDTGDVANNQYYLYKQDIARIAAMGIKVYSFSIAWARIFPFGSGQVNEQGLAHYQDVIDTCLEYGIQPAITLFHWDLPLALQNSYGGLLSSKFIDDFVEYARIIFTRFGDKVDHFATFNEPTVICGFYPLPEGYFKATSIPAEQQPYYCGQNLLIAHSKAYHLAKSLNLTAQITIKLNGGYKLPLTNSSADLEAVQRAWDWNEGLWAKPIFLDGDYPASVKEYVSTFLPELTSEQKAALNGTADLFAHDAYTSHFYSAPDSGIADCVANVSHPLFPTCVNETWAYTAASGGWALGPAADPLAPWLHKATEWVPAFMRYIQETWKPRGGILITEFGFAEPFEAQKTLLQDILMDQQRSAYFKGFMEGVLMAIAEGTNVVGTLAWSLIDNLEWTSGNSVKFGLQYVNYTTQERYYKASLFHFADVYKKYVEQ
ncbi:glycoside hydrolase superfamily [Phyllosticta citriasiana]|uniref:Glycoside hydrolase superfamily n=1 Tax=Phyllosticta citriasiana TaxID=595635 RepID=A0ABR1KLR9_9PEZI